MTATFYPCIGFSSEAMVDLTGKSWADLYREALLEVNPNRLPHLVELAMESVQSKLHKSDDNITPVERQALEDALQNLRVLQREYS
jgi:hypothetical protein